MTEEKDNQEEEVVTSTSLLEDEQRLRDRLKQKKKGRSNQDEEERLRSSLLQKAAAAKKSTHHHDSKSSRNDDPVEEPSTTKSSRGGEATPGDRRDGNRSSATNHSGQQQRRRQDADQRRSSSAASSSSHQDGAYRHRSSSASRNGGGGEYYHPHRQRRHQRGYNGHRRRRGPPPPRDYHPRDYPHGPPPPHHGAFLEEERDDFGRRQQQPRRPSNNRSSSYSRSYSRSRSRDRGRSRSRSNSYYDNSRSPDSDHDDRSHSAHSSSSGSSSDDGSSSRSSRSSSSSSSASSHHREDDGYTKDQRTVFVTQLVMRTAESDLHRFFNKSHGIRTNEITFLRDRSTGKHKGSAYVELRRMADVSKAVALSSQPPDFQRFPILIKASEAEKNYVNTAAASVPKVYVGNLDVNLVTSQHLQALFSAFGNLESVTLTPGKGYGFLQYTDIKSAHLALQTMAGQVLAGRPMKTGWANTAASENSKQLAAAAAAEFPPDATERVQNAYKVLAQLTGGVTVPPVMPPAVMAAATSSSRVPTVADARASLAAAAATPTNVQPILPKAAPIARDDPTKIGNADRPTRNVLVHNMFDKDQETEEGWETEIREEFEEECSKYGKILNVVVASREAGGKIYASFQDIASAQTCASSLAGRWFDKRQLSVEYISDDIVAAVQQEYKN